MKAELGKYWIIAWSFLIFCLTISVILRFVWLDGEGEFGWHHTDEVNILFRVQMVHSSRRKDICKQHGKWRLMGLIKSCQSSLSTYKIQAQGLEVRKGIWKCWYIQQVLYISYYINHQYSTLYVLFLCIGPEANCRDGSWYWKVGFEIWQ